MIDLAGQWRLADADGGHGCDIHFPGDDGITALNRAGLIPDPYWGRNEYDLRWICESDWVARREVTLDDTDVDLVLSGVDTVATVAINGTVVLTAQNSFRDYRVPLNGIARTGTNDITITFRSPVRAAAELQAAQPFRIPYHVANSPIANGNMLRKVQCDFGWDWNVALAPFGLYGAVRIEPSAAPRIDRVAVDQVWADDGAVAVTIRVLCSNAGAHEAQITFAGESVSVPAQDGLAEIIFDIDNPTLWWPNGQGAQILHDLRITLGDAVVDRKIGLRRIDLVTAPDAAGLSFGFRVNGRDVFAKGANWIPADALHGRIDRAATEALLQSAADAHMNMIRVWGGGRYEPDWFYDACDRLGLMVWQDFMFACHLYPSTADFLAEVVEEVRQQVARLDHHACLALWCGDNELIGALTWFEESRTDRDRYLVNYDRLNRTIEATLKETAPSANWWPSSPSPGPMNFGDAWHSDGAGDMHFWSVWHEGRDFDHYRDVAPRFCSEFGFQSYPSMQAIRTFAAPEDWNIAAPVFESHQKNAGGNARIAETMFRYFRWPERFEDFVWLSQIQQGLAIKTAVTHWRGLKPHCMGTLYWQLNDTWPVCSWSSLDYGGNWKMLHHMARRFFAPVTVICTPRDGTLALVAVNDRPEALTFSVTARAVAMSGALRDLGQANATVGAAAETLLTLPATDLRADEMLVFTWETDRGDRGGDHFAALPYKAYDLPDPGLTLTQDGLTLTVSSTALAHFVTIEADIPGRFSNNAFLLFPDSPATVTFTPSDPSRSPTFTLRDLHSATVVRPAPQHRIPA